MSTSREGSNPFSSDPDTDEIQRRQVIDKICSNVGSGITDERLIQLLRTMPDIRTDEAKQKILAEKLSVGDQDAKNFLAEWFALDYICEANHITPSDLLSSVQYVKAMELTREKLAPLWDVGRQVAASRSAAITDVYFESNWKEIKDWWVFPRALGVWVSIVIAAATLAPGIALGAGLATWVLLKPLTEKFWIWGHEDGDALNAVGQATRFWKVTKPIRTLISSLPMRLCAMVACGFLVWAQGGLFDIWWGLLVLFCAYDILQAVESSNRPAPKARDYSET